MIHWGKEGVVLREIHGSPSTGLLFELGGKTAVEGEVASYSCKSRVRMFGCRQKSLQRVYPVVCAYLSVLPVQMEQQNNGIDVDHDADLAYNSLKVRLSVLCHSWASRHWVTRRAIDKWLHSSTSTLSPWK